MQALLLSLASGEGNQRQEESGFGVFIFLITFSLEAVDLLCLSTKGRSPVWAALSLPLLSIDSFFFNSFILAVPGLRCCAQPSVVATGPGDRLSSRGTQV